MSLPFLNTAPARTRREWHCPQVAKFPGPVPGELTGHELWGAVAHLRRGRAEELLDRLLRGGPGERRPRVRAGFPRRKRGLVPGGASIFARSYSADDTLHLGEQPGPGGSSSRVGASRETAPPHHGRAQARRARSPGGRRPGRDDPATGNLTASRSPASAAFTKSIEGRGDPGRAPEVPVIDELCDQLVALGHRPRSRSAGDLGADGAPGFLGLGRDPCIDGHSHRHASFLDNGQLTWERQSKQLVAGSEAPPGVDRRREVHAGRGGAHQAGGEHRHGSLARR